MSILSVNVVRSHTNINQNVMDKVDNDKQEILEVTRKLTDLMIERDTLGIENIVDADFTLTHITGYMQSKSEWFSEIETEQMKYYLYEEVKTSVIIDGDKATFIGQNLLDAQFGVLETNGDYNKQWN